MVTSVTAPELRDLDDAQMYQLTGSEAAEILATLAGASGNSPAPADVGEFRVLPAPPAEPPGTSQAQPARVAVLGPFQLSVGGTPVTKGLRRKAAELLTFLAVHRDGATTGVILDALWQDVPVARAGPILHAATTNIRKILRDATGVSEAAFIIRANDHARIDPSLVSVDLWQFQDALAAAAHAAGDDERAVSLQFAASLWRGDVGPGSTRCGLMSTARRSAAMPLTRLLVSQSCRRLGILSRALPILSVPLLSTGTRSLCTGGSCGFRGVLGGLTRLAVRTSCLSRGSPRLKSSPMSSSPSC
jgi:hypothetical protein